MARRKNSYKTGDRFNQRAKDEGFRARSVYKLTEIDKRHRVLTQGQKVLDLGCAPGSWARYARQKVGRRGAVLGVDLKHVESLAGVQLIQADVFQLEAATVLEQLDGPVDLVLSDMAPNTTGDRFGDHVRQLEVARRALTIARQVLAPGGHFVCKVFDGEDAPDFVTEVRQCFDKVKRARPDAVRRESVEFFVVGLGFTP